MATDGAWPLALQWASTIKRSVTPTSLNFLDLLQSYVTAAVHRNGCRV